MKHFLSRALMVAAVLAAGSQAFAQLTINGYYRVGSMTNVDTNNNVSTAFQDRIRLNLSFAAPDDMYGFKARLQADSSGANSGLVNLFAVTAATTGTVDTTVAATKQPITATTTVTPPAILKYGYGYAKALDGMVKLSAGYLDLTDYAVAQNTGNYYFGNVFTDDVTGAATPNLSGQKGKFLGTALQAWPVEGLSIAATVRTDGSIEAAHHLGLDAYYLIPGLGKAILASQLGVYSATSASASDDLSRSFVSGGFSYVGLPGLSATAVLRSTYASNASALGSVAIVEYAVGPLFADLAGDVDFTNSHYYLEGEASYLVIPQVKVRAYGAYADAVTANIKINGAGNQSSLGFDLVLPIGKGEIQAGIVYGDKSNVQFPVLVKANF
jgi:hypothetical protein